METGRRRRWAARLGSTVLLASKLSGVASSIVDEPGWNPKTSTELFLGLLPYLLVFVIVPICLLLVCWCSKYLIFLCCKKPVHSSAFWQQFLLRTNTQTPIPDPNRDPNADPPAANGAPTVTAASVTLQEQQPATLFTNYTNYNPILEGELDLFPITYNADEAAQQIRRNNGAHALNMAYFPESETTIGIIDSACTRNNDENPRGDVPGENARNPTGNAENPFDDPPPYYQEDPPPSYDSLFTSGQWERDLLEKNDGTGDDAENLVPTTKSEIENVNSNDHVCVN